MALVISTKDQLYLTGLQHRAINKSTSITQEAEILNAGNKMLVTIKGGTTNTLSIATGFVVLSGVVVENTTVVEKTFGNPVTAGNYVLVFKIDMSTNTPSLNTQLASVSRTTNDLTVTTGGIYEYVLATMTVSATGVISNLVSTVPRSTPVPVGSMVQQGVTNFFKPSVNQNITAGQTPTIALVRQVGGLSIDGSYYITLPKGYFYELDFGLSQFVSAGNGALAIARIVKSDGAATGYGTDAGSIGATNANGRMDTPNGTHIIDLTGAGADVVIKYMLAYTDVNCTINKDSTFVKIKQYKKAV